MKKTLLSFIVFISFASFVTAQRFNYENTSKLFVGFQLGYNWHTSDVLQVEPKFKFPVGLGFMLGGSLNQDYGRFLSYDIRAKFYFGNWYGQDKVTTTKIKENIPVNNLYQPLGYTVQNFKSTQFHTALELAVHFNRVKERTGIDPYLFGGIGFTSTRTRGNLLKHGIIYPYNQTANWDVLDKSYETPLLKNDVGNTYDEDNGQFRFLPSLGFGIGYYFNSRFSVGFEHTTTFFSNDFFDGTTVTQSGKASHPFTKDLYHFTSVYFRWYFKKRSYRHTPQPETPPTDRTPDNQNDPDQTHKNDELNETNNSTQRDPIQPPFVRFTNPAKDFISTQKDFTIRANIKYVSGSENLRFTQNGANHKTFIYNPNTDFFESKVHLIPGENVFRLIGENKDGQASDEVIIVYKRMPRDEIQPPVVNIVTPTTSPYTSNKPNQIVKAAIYRVKNRNQISVTLNNQPFTAFSFSSQGGINFSANVFLQKEVSTLRIVATNEAGTDTDETVLILNNRTPQEHTAPPLVGIEQPAVSPFYTELNYREVVATVKNVTQKNQIQVTVNNVTTSQFSYNAVLNRVIFNAALTEGINTVRIKATNPFGFDNDATQIVLKKKPRQPKVDPPTVQITKPSAYATETYNANAAIVAVVNNVDDRSHINVSINGSTTKNFIFKENKQRIELQTSLVMGANTILIRVFNSEGEATDNVVIKRKRKGTPPKVQIISPQENPTTVYTMNTKVIAQVQNISGANQIQVWVNSQPINSVIFNAINHQVQFVAHLSASMVNKIKIKVNNTFGTAIDNTQIYYKRKLTEPKPTVYFTKPTKSGTVVSLSKYTFEAAVNNVTQKSDIQLYFNGMDVANNSFSYFAATGKLQYSTDIKNGTNQLKIVVSNNVGSAQASIKVVRLTVTDKTTKVERVTKLPTCGTMIDVSGISPEFCLQTPEGRYDAAYLKTHPNFSYQGLAKIIYFKVGRNGKEKVGNETINTKDNYFYFFTGNLQVDIKKNRQGYDGEWSVCLTAQRYPEFGIGRNKPRNPCLSTTTGDDDGRVIRVPEPNRKPIIRRNPGSNSTPGRETKPTIRNKPSTNQDSSSPRRTPRDTRSPTRR